MRKISLQILAFCFVIAGISSCGEKKNQETQAAADDEWTMMDEFHVVMAGAFHPYKDSANLQPAKEQAPQMASVAERWASSPLPQKVDNDHVKAKLAKLKETTKAFEQTVKTESDEVIGESLNKLHDDFHELQDAWYHSGDDHSGHGHQH